MRIVHRGQTPSILHWLTLGLSALLLGACATQGDIMDNLNTTLRGYEKAVRWAKFDAVYAYHVWKEGQESTPPANMENIRVTKYEASAQKYDPKENIMKQTVTLRYYNTEDSRERSLKFHHEWKYFADTKRWYLISEPISFP